MKHHYVILLCCLLFAIPVAAQKAGNTVRLKSGTLTNTSNIQSARLPDESRQRMAFRKKHYVLLRFSKLPAAQVRQELASQGISLFDYIPGNAYFAELPEQVIFSSLKKYDIDGVFIPGRSVKISNRLLQQPAKTTIDQDEVIAVNFFGSITRKDVITELMNAGAQIAQTDIQPSHIVFVHASTPALEKIAALPFVTYVDKQSLKDKPLNFNNRGSNGISALSLPQGRNLQGQGVTVGVGDDGDPTHVDLSGRLILRNPIGPTYHASHTTGTTGGAGIRNPRNKGMAPKATLISHLFSNILVNTPLYANDYGMVLTNNSYESSEAGCVGTGDYDALSNYVDAQMNNNASLLHVFASGNSGASICTPYLAPFATVRSGFQSSKNALDVGNIDNANNTISSGSSSGPVDDGRLKPEIVAGGTNITSTTTSNGYGPNGGTSMAAPAVTGALALLYERYRQLHGGANPPGSLIKAAACNTAEDKGNPGPDFKYGFGKLNARAAAALIEDNHYFINTMSNGGVANHTIPAVPAGTYQLKIMLYWVDPAASPVAPLALVNNLDLTATGTDALLHRPLVLNSNFNNVNIDAIEGIDNINNIEQVVINDPPAGDVTIAISGTNIPVGPQNYVVVYQVIQPSVIVEYPFGSETLVPGETEYIRWSAYGGGNNTFTIELSTDNGASWGTINNNVPASSRLFAWTPVPNTPTNQALVRVTRNSSGLSDISDQPFSILEQPVLTVTNPCPGYAQLSWPAIPSATSYEITMLRGDSMQVVATTNAIAYLLEGLQKDSSYWIAVRPLAGSIPGRRSVAINVLPNTGNCLAATFNNDLSIDSLLPVSGRMFTSSQLSNQAIHARIRNNGAIATSGTIDIYYQVNGGTIVHETTTQVIAGATAVDFPFAQFYDFSAVGAYQIKAWVKYTGDPLLLNDTLSNTIKQLQNDPIPLNPSFTEGFETAAIQTYTRKTTGFEGLDRCDFNASNANGRVRTFINTGFARTGNRYIALDRSRSAATTADSVITTFNLSNYSSTDQLWLDFYYRNQGTDFVAAGNRVWIRGNDQAAWIPVFTLPLNVNEFGLYKPATSINITGTLAGAIPAQTISGSFQVKFGEQAFATINSVVPPANLDDGIIYDDVIITRASDDVGILSIVDPITTNICGLSNAEPLRVQLKNYSANNLTNVAVSYQLNGNVVTQNISLTPNETLTYIFPAPVNLSAFQAYTLRAWVHYNSDNYPNNDSTAEVQFVTTPLITGFPYLETFDTNNGYWYTGGANSSWEWGPPVKTIIDKAASGSNAWVTSLAGNYNDNELSYLYSPCFNLTGMTQPVLSFSHIFRTEDNCDCDYHWVEYSTNDVTWTKLGNAASGTNWYNNAGKQAWQLSGTTWRVSSINIPSPFAKVRFRIVMKSDGGVTLEGPGIDDVHIFDKAAIYTGADIVSGLSQPVSGNSWVHFSSGGNRVASIHPQGQDLGNTTIKLFNNIGAVRNTHGQYYLDRNIVIESANPPAANVLVRFYFSNTEANNLVNATGCPSCTKPADPYEAGVTQYSGANENGTLSDNDVPGNYQFFQPSTAVSIVPYDNGYYAAFAVNHFSEFWINGGGIGQNQPLPVVLEAFTATKNKTTALLQWTTSQEINSHVFMIEKSTDGVHYSKIGEVNAAGNSQTPLHYQFTDQDLQAGINYYRLVMTDINGVSRYSPIRTITQTENDFIVTCYPNPVSKGMLYIKASVECERIELTDLSGRIIKSIQVHGRQPAINLTGIAKGTYFISIFTSLGKKVQPVVIGNE